MSKLAIIGGGSWGTALSVVLTPKFDQVWLWVHEPDLAREIRSSRQNMVYLPGVELADGIEVSTDLEATLDRADFVLGVMPSRFARGLYARIGAFAPPGAIYVSATKGLESGSLLRMSEVIAQSLSSRFAPRVAVLSGPTFASEIARGEPAAVVIASTDAPTAGEVQQAFSGKTMRLYANPDPVGVEIGAALKNVIAIGAGICRGLGLGNNTLAALITRGLAEITRLAVALGGQPRTLAGLAGLGDLVLTCTGDLSRNRMVGVELGKGRPLADILGSMQMVAEGVHTVGSAMALARQTGVEMPITEQMELVLNEGKPPREALRDLMERSLKSE